jgi:hypothetical protein
MSGAKNYTGAGTFYKNSKRIIARKVVESLSNLDRLSRKAAGFDKERFKSDVIKLFKDNNLL